MGFSIITDFSNVSKEGFKSFITNISDDFVPSLLPRIEIDKYYDKLKRFATVVFCMEGNRIVGMVATYCNNQETKMAYTSLVAVDKDYRGLHIATKMMEITIACAKQMGMEKIGLHANSIVARDFYLKIGFHVIDVKHINELSLDRYYLEFTL